jgi:hypothetical protein
MFIVTLNRGCNTQISERIETRLEAERVIHLLLVRIEKGDSVGVKKI